MNWEFRDETSTPTRPPFERPPQNPNRTPLAAQVAQAGISPQRAAGVFSVDVVLEFVTAEQIDVIAGVLRRRTQLKAEDELDQFRQRNDPGGCSLFTGDD